MMLNRIRRFRKAWAIADEPIVDQLYASKEKLPSTLSYNPFKTQKAEFLPDMNSEELVEYLEEQRGWKDWLEEQFGFAEREEPKP